MTNLNSKISRLGAINPYWDPPRESIWYDLVEDVTVSNTDGDVELLSFALPIASIGTIRWFGQLSSGSYDNITWKIRVNDGPDTVYGTVRGLISTLEAPDDILVKIPRGGKIKLLVSCNIATPVRAIGRLKGWYWEDDLL